MKVGTIMNGHWYPDKKYPREPITNYYKFEKEWIDGFCDRGAGLEVYESYHGVHLFHTYTGDYLWSGAKDHFYHVWYGDMKWKSYLNQEDALRKFHEEVAYRLDSEED